MSGEDDNSYSDSDYYDVDFLTYYDETEDFSEEIEREGQDKTLPTKSDIEDSYSSTVECFKQIEIKNIDEPCTDLPKEMHTVDVDAELSKSLTDDLIDSDSDEDMFKRKSDCLDDVLIGSKTNTDEYDETAENTSTLYAEIEEKTDLNKKFTPETLNKLRRLLFNEAHSSGDQKYYIGDLLQTIESELMKLPKEKKKVIKEPPVYNKIKPKKPKQNKSYVLSRNAIRLMGGKRDYHMQNMKVLATSISKEFIELDDMIEHFRQIHADFEEEFNQPHTPLGEANFVNQRMENLFCKFKERIPELQDRYKEVKHCLRLYVKNDKILDRDLLKNIKRYFVKSKLKNFQSVQYGEILEAIGNSNRLHCEF